MRAVVLGVLLVAGSATASAALDVPPLTGRVVDLADVLSPSTEATLTSLLAAHQDSTSNQVVVLTIPSLDGEILEPYATRVFREWGLGQAGTDNGVLLLVAVGDREVRIEVGYGLEGDLTDATSGTIIRQEIVPRFRDGDFDAGVLGGVEAILGTIEGTYQPRAPSGVLLNGRPAEDQPVWLRLVFLLFFGGIGFVPLALAVYYAPSTEPAAEKSLGCVGMITGAFIGAGAIPLLVTGWAACGGILLAPLAAVYLNRWIDRHPTLGPERRQRIARGHAIREARRRGQTEYVLGGETFPVPTPSSSGGGSFGGGSGGGGFSGGGGSSGGGGASGSW